MSLAEAASGRALTELVQRLAVESPSEIGYRTIIAVVDDARSLAAWAAEGLPDPAEVEWIARVLLRDEKHHRRQQ